ncbi:MAG: hypothetical protein IPO92_00675 [Saprospiraceae bacterium]|nr:hypothetical protein [Saprospiraceae bacterium]
MELSAQAPGIAIQAGLSTAYSKDENVTKSNQAHYGYFIGADARLLDGDMYFIIGGQYHLTSLQSSSSPKFFTNNDWKIFMGRLGLGFNVFKLSEGVVLRSKILASINFTLDSPANGLNIPGYEAVNDSFLGITTGAGLTLGIFDFDLDFQYGVINAYQFRPKSTFNSLTLMAGIHF